MSNDLAAAIRATAARIGANPVDLATVMSYETAGTFDPAKSGPRTQWGQHRGLIQWGEPQAQKYGVDFNGPVSAQVDAAGRYLQDAGFKPGMSRLDMYSAINAGRVGRNNASDANNGGAPGTVFDKVNSQMSGHEKKALALLGGGSVPSMSSAPIPQGATPLSNPQQTSFGSLAPSTEEPQGGGLPSVIASLLAPQQQPQFSPMPQLQFGAPQAAGLGQYLAALGGLS